MEVKGGGRVVGGGGGWLERRRGEPFEPQEDGGVVRMVQRVAPRLLKEREPSTSRHFGNFVLCFLPLVFSFCHFNYPFSERERFLCLF